MNLIINEDYRSLLPRLSNDEYQELKESIEKIGLIYPIIINKDGVILDGYHRYTICKELNIEPKVIVREFNDKLEEKEFVIEVNLKRRHLDIIQRCELAEKIEEIEKEKARIRKLLTLKQFRDTDSSKLLLSEGDKGRAASIAAKKVGVSAKTYQKYKFVKQYYPEMLENIKKEKGKKPSIDHIYGETRRLLNIKGRQEPKLVTDSNSIKRYNVILADPPYDYDIKLRANPSIHYKTLTDDQIYNFLKDNNLEDKIDDNAILFLWSTNPKLREALKIIEAWNFEYKTNMVWIKDKIGLGYYVRSKHELLLIAVKGNIVPLESNRPESVIYHNRSIHSKKPLIVYDIIEHMYPNAI